MRISWGYLKSQNFVATEHGINFASLSAIPNKATVNAIALDLEDMSHWGNGTKA
jgi:hypothetical protein